KLVTVGEFDALHQHTKNAINHANASTLVNGGLLLNFALKYDSRYEMVLALKSLAADVRDEELELDAIDEELIGNCLYTNDLQDPDLLIRTSGEQRLSNFLLWQSAYTEFWFTDVLWPDFSEAIFKEALLDYQQRVRRYGGV